MNLVKNAFKLILMGKMLANHVLVCPGIKEHVMGFNQEKRG